MTTARTVARDVLVRVEGGAFSHVLLPETLRSSDLSPRDRAFATELVYGTLRELRRLDALLTPHGRRSIDELDPPVRAVLRLGAHQLEAGVPKHAAVSETVTAAPERARGYVNAVLRSLSSAGPPFAEPDEPAVALSYPDWLVARLTDDLGATHAHALLRASNEPPAVTLRPNRTRADGHALLDELRAANVDAETGTLVPDAIAVRRTGDLSALPAVAQGRATPQDQASQAVVEILDPQRGERVLDVAAAPGGKATAAAERVGASGSVIALDLNGGRLALVRTAATRLGLSNLAIARADATALPVQASSFDRVLVDAPCSGLGVLRRRSEARWRVQPEAVAPLAQLQADLVIEAARAVRPGGRLVYSVCTVTAEETIGVAERALGELRGFDVIPPPSGWRLHGAGGLVLPQDFGTDGMFVLGLRRA